MSNYREISYMKALICITLFIIVLGFYLTMVYFYEGALIEFLKGFLPSLAVVLFGVAVIYFFYERKGLGSWDIFSKSTSEHVIDALKNDTIRDSGLIEIYKTRRETLEKTKYGIWDTYLDYASGSQEIDMLGINVDGISGITGFPDTIANDDEMSRIIGNSKRLQKIIKRIRGGASVRVIIPEIMSDYLKLRSETENINSPLDRWNKRIPINTYVLEFVRDKFLLDQEKGRLQIRKYDNILYYFMIRSGDLMLVSPYVGYTEGDLCPAIVLRDIGDNSLFRSYKEDFDSIFHACSRQAM